MKGTFARARSSQKDRFFPELAKRDTGMDINWMNLKLSYLSYVLALQMPVYKMWRVLEAF